jgi:hypothetical protein
MVISLFFLSPFGSAWNSKLPPLSSTLGGLSSQNREESLQQPRLWLYFRSFGFNTCRERLLLSPVHSCDVGVGGSEKCFHQSYFPAKWLGYVWWWKQAKHSDRTGVHKTVQVGLNCHEFGKD